MAMAALLITKQHHSCHGVASALAGALHIGQRGVACPPGRQVGSWHFRIDGGLSRSFSSAGSAPSRPQSVERAPAPPSLSISPLDITRLPPLNFEGRVIVISSKEEERRIQDLQRGRNMVLLDQSMTQSHKCVCVCVCLMRSAPLVQMLGIPRHASPLQSLRNSSEAFLLPDQPKPREELEGKNEREPSRTFIALVRHVQTLTKLGPELSF